MIKRGFLALVLAGLTLVVPRLGQAVSIVTFNETAVNAFVGGLTAVGFDGVPGNGGGGSGGNTGVPVFPASAIDDEFQSLGILISSTGGPAVAVSVQGLPNQSDARSPFNVLGGTSLNTSGVAVVNYFEPINIQFVVPGTSTASTGDLVGTWLDPTGSRVRLEVFDATNVLLDSIEGNQGQFIGISIPGIARASFSFVQTQSVPGFSIDDLFVGPVSEPIPEPSTLLLLGSGLVGMGTRAWRRSRRK